MNAGPILLLEAPKRLKNRGLCGGRELTSSTGSRAFLRMNIRRKNQREGLFLFRFRAIMMLDAVYIEERQ